MSGDPIADSQALLRAVREGAATGALETAIAAYESDALARALDGDDARTAFWLNVYNAHAQLLVERQPDRFGWRLFRAREVPVADHWLSLDRIEHGILRRSQWQYGLGYVRKPDLLVSPFERAHRVDARDPRIHFALNCGAASCPPIAVYTDTDLDAELDLATESYLASEAGYDPVRDVATVPRLCRWYRGDFGGRSGIRDLLARYDVVPPGADPSLEVAPYDWTIAPRQFRGAEGE
jgi:hypothetical protein